MNDYREIIQDFYVLSREEQEKAIAHAVAFDEHDRIYNKIQYFKPNPSQLKLVENTNRYDEILCSWANRTGKTFIVGAILYYHATGNYPNWWIGKRFNRPVRIMIMGVTRTSLRESAQRILLDEYQTGEEGTGIIPRHILEISDIKKSKDDNNCIDFMRIPHVSGGKSYLLFTTQQVDWKSIQGTEFDICWADEQLEGDGNPPRHYSQFLRATATQIGKRLILLTATPENGHTPIFDYFEKSESNKNQRIIHYATLYDAHYSREYADRMRESYPEDEWEYRVYGRPKHGTGLVYRFSREMLFCQPIEIHENWKRIVGIDFGRTNSKTALVWIAQNPTSGVYYVYDTDWRRNADPKDVVPLINRRDQLAKYKIPIAWPKDGINTESSTGNQIAKIYANHDIRMLSEPAMMMGRDGKKSMSVEAGVAYVQGMIDAGLLKIFETPDNQVFVEELGFYHRDENNKITKNASNDPHHLDALRYGLVMFDRFAMAKANYRNPKVPLTIGMVKGIFHN